MKLCVSLVAFSTDIRYDFNSGAPPQLISFRRRLIKFTRVLVDLALIELVQRKRADLNAILEWLGRRMEQEL